MKDTPIELMTVAEAARYHGVAPQTIYAWLKEGRLEEYPGIPGQVLLSAADVRKCSGKRSAGRRGKQS